jgi:predicted transcriptional regulator
MNTSIIKQQLHQQIDLIEDETQLQILNDVATEYVSNSKIVLTDEQNDRLQESIKQANEGKLIDHKEVIKLAEKWLTK